MNSSSPVLSALNISTPPQSTLSSRRSSKSTGSKTPLSLDFSDLPPLITPSPPTNTLLITALNDAQIFLPENLQVIRDIINTHVLVHTWSPLKSMRRIIVSFFSVEDATLIRKTLDCEVIFDQRVRIYFGAETKISPTEDQYLKAPMADKQFFISPPPSPPHGWEMRNEGPPNTEVHAEDLAVALARLHARDQHYQLGPQEGMDMEVDTTAPPKMRSRSQTLVYHPDQHGDSPALPAISVEDTSDSDYELEYSPMQDVSIPHTRTSRPPVELMEH